MRILPWEAIGKCKSNIRGNENPGPRLCEKAGRLQSRKVALLLQCSAESRDGHGPPERSDGPADAVEAAQAVRAVPPFLLALLAGGRLDEEQPPGDEGRHAVRHDADADEAHHAHGQVQLPVVPRALVDVDALLVARAVVAAHHEQVVRVQRFDVVVVGGPRAGPLVLHLRVPPLPVARVARAPDHGHAEAVQQQHLLVDEEPAHVHEDADDDADDAERHQEVDVHAHELEVPGRCESERKRSLASGNGVLT